MSLLLYVNGKKHHRGISHMDIRKYLCAVGAGCGLLAAPLLLIGSIINNPAVLLLGYLQFFEAGVCTLIVYVKYSDKKGRKNLRSIMSNMFMGDFSAVKKFVKEEQKNDGIR